MQLRKNRKRMVNYRITTHGIWHTDENMLDTLKYSKHLRQAGVPESQAEAQAEALSEALSESLATKGDIIHVEERLSGDITLLRWMTGVSISLGVAILVKLFLVPVG